MKKVLTAILGFAGICLFAEAQQGQNYGFLEISGEQFENPTSRFFLEYHDDPTNDEKFKTLEKLLIEDMENGDNMAAERLRTIYMRRSLESFRKDFLPVAKKASLKGDMSGLAYIYIVFSEFDKIMGEQILAEIHQISSAEMPDEDALNCAIRKARQNISNNSAFWVLPVTSDDESGVSAVNKDQKAD